MPDMDWYVIWDYRSALMDGVQLTVELSVLAIVGGTFIGILIGCLRALPSFYLKRIGDTYAEFFRNTPVLVKLFFLHFVISLDAFPAGLTALILHASSYISDVTLAGFRSIPHGQTEAARSCGLSYFKLFRYILVPQAIRFVIPPMTTQYTQIVKDSSVVSLIALEELTFMASMINLDTYRGFEAAAAVTMIYLFLVLLVAAAMTMLQRFVDRKIVI